MARAKKFTEIEIKMCAENCWFWPLPKNWYWDDSVTKKFYQLKNGNRTNRKALKYMDDFLLDTLFWWEAHLEENKIAPYERAHKKKHGEFSESIKLINALVAEGRKYETINQ